MLNNIRCMEIYSMPCVYCLDYSHKPVGVIVKINRHVIRDGFKPDPDDDYSHVLGEKETKSTFCLDFEKAIGFGGEMKKIGQSEAFNHYLLKYPVCSFLTKYRMCDGTGKDTIVGGSCRNCQGSGKVSHDLWGAAIGGYLSREIIEYLSLFGANQTIKSIRTVLIQAYRRLTQERIDKFAEFSFRACNSGECGRLNIDVPGNATGIQVDGMTKIGNNGVQFTDHNMDNFFQQLTIIATLAKLCGETRMYLGQEI